MKPQQTNNQFRTRVNYYIKVPQIKLVLEDGSFIGIMSTRDALKMAQEQGLDLVEINPRVSPPICKIIDYGKFKYEEKKKQNAAKQKQKHSELKEVVFRPNTEENDLKHKLNSAKEFLSEGHKVKFTVKFRGREITHPQLGKEKLEWFLSELKDLISVNSPISIEGKHMSMTLSPK